MPTLKITRKHQGIIQTGGNKGKLKKGYKYSGKKLKNGLPQIVKVKKKQKKKLKNPFKKQTFIGSGGKNYKIFVYYEPMPDVAQSFTMKGWKTLLTENGFPEENLYTFNRFKSPVSRTGGINCTFKEFKKEVIQNTNKTDKGIMILFSFHGADWNERICECKDGKTVRCRQGNLILYQDDSDILTPTEYISGLHIAHFVEEIPSQEIVIFSLSCFSGHFIQKINKELIGNNTKKNIALISSDDKDKMNTTNTLDYPYLYKNERNLYSKKQSISYNNIDNFEKYAKFIKDYEGSNFSCIIVNGGKEIKTENYGLTTKFISRYDINNKNIKDINIFLDDVNLKNLMILVVQTEEDYRNLTGDDHWIDGFVDNGVKKENIHFIKVNPSRCYGSKFKFHTFSSFNKFSKTIPKNTRILLFIRGFGRGNNLRNEDLTKWKMDIGEWGGKKFITTQTIEAYFFPLLKKHYSLVVIVSPYADKAQKELLNLDPKLKVVSFWSRYKALKIFGWSFNPLAPLYKKYKPSLMNYEYVYKQMGNDDKEYNRIMKQTTEHIEQFITINNFSDYFNFASRSSWNADLEDIEVKENEIIDKKDIKTFGFLPERIPETWILNEWKIAEEKGIVD